MNDIKKEYKKCLENTLDIIFLTAFVVLVIWLIDSVNSMKINLYWYVMNNDIDDDKAKIITEILNNPTNKMLIVMCTVVATIVLIKCVNIKWTDQMNLFGGFVEK